MTILWVTFGMPWPPDSGARMRDYHLIREVSRHARILLFCLVPPGGATEPGKLNGLCAGVETWEMPARFPPLYLLATMPAGAWRNYFPAAAAKIRAIAVAERPDVIQIEHSLLAAYIDAVPNGFVGRSLISLHNVAFEQYRRMAALDCGIVNRAAYLLKAWMMRRAEKYYIPRFSSCLTVSGADRDLIRRIVPSSDPAVIANGVDCGANQPPNADGAVLLFAGVMGYPPNADGAVFFCRSILPRIRAHVPDVKLLIVGHSPPAMVTALSREQGVTVTGWVEDMQPFYEQASVSIVPLRAGGGTRLKILEAMALGRPVVSTSIGCEGLDVQHNLHLMIANDAEQFADYVTSLLLDAGLRERLATEARRLVEQRYDWSAIGRQLLSNYSAK